MEHLDAVDEDDRNAWRNVWHPEVELDAGGHALVVWLHTDESPRSKPQLLYSVWYK